MDSKLFQNVTKRNLRNMLLFYSTFGSIFVIELILSIIFFDFYITIFFIIFCLMYIVTICISIYQYLKINQNKNIKEGTILYVQPFRGYHITIQADSGSFVAFYPFISAKIKKMVGHKCTFVTNDKGKAYIKEIKPIESNNC